MKSFADARRFLFGFPEGSLESWLASDGPAEHALADEALQQMGEERALAFLLSTIEAEEGQRKRRGHRNAVLIWVGTLIAMLLLAYIGYWHHTIFMTVQNTAFYFAFITFLAGGIPSRLHKQCVERLAKTEDRRTLPALVAAITNPYRIQANTVARRLTQMLPKMEAEDFAALTKDQQQRFLNFINPKFASNKNTDRSARQELARAILLAVTRLDKAEALPATKRLANAKAKAREDDTLQRTAQNCLPLLEKARDEQKMRVTEERKVIVRR